MEGLNLSEDEEDDDWETASGEFTESETEIQISPKSDNHNINNRKGTCKLKYVLAPFFRKWCWRGFDVFIRFAPVSSNFGIK